MRAEIRNLIGVAAVLPLLLMAGAPAARDLPESTCSWIIRTEDGRFYYQMQPSWTLQSAAASAQGVVLPDNVAGITCLRDPPVLVESDATVLLSGRSISLGGMGRELLMITYEIVDGRVTHRIASGTSSGRLPRQIEQGMAAVQAIIDSSGN
jgi:hypothetical protein